MSVKCHFFHVSHASCQKQTFLGCSLLVRRRLVVTENKEKNMKERKKERKKEKKKERNGGQRVGCKHCSYNSQQNGKSTILLGVMEPAKSGAGMTCRKCTSLDLFPLVDRCTLYARYRVALVTLFYSVRSWHIYFRSKCIVGSCSFDLFYFYSNLTFAYWK